MRKSFSTYFALSAALGLLGFVTVPSGTMLPKTPPPLQVDIILALPPAQQILTAPEPLLKARHLTVEERTKQVIAESNWQIMPCVYGPSNKLPETATTDWILAKIQSCAQRVALDEAMAEHSSN